MLIEGRNSVREAIKNNITINKLYIDKNLSSRKKDDIINEAFNKKIKVEFLPKTILDRTSKTQKHQGFIADAVDFNY